MRKIIIIFILLISINSVSAADITNITNIGICPEIVGGTNVISFHPHYVDNWFSVYNNGYVTYQIYAYNYTGIHDPLYTNSFIGAIEPNQIGILNNNASYYFYADYDNIQDYTDVEKVKDKFNIWWIYIFIGTILFSIIVLGIKKVLRI